MLHNSGPFGPNDVPINMGAPVNVSQISNPVNIGNNLSNLGKMPPQAPQATPPQYNIPDYSSFGHPPLSMGHPMSPFANYQHMNFQGNYGQPGSHLPHESSLNSIQNGMLPMNLNIQSDHSSNFTNYHSYDSKRMDLNTSHLRDHYSRKMPINIPQIHSKVFHKQLETESYEPYNSIQENPFHHQDLSKTPEKTLLDSRRRKSLENTVKLIENILINNTPKDKLRSVNIEPVNKHVINIPNVENPNKKLGKLNNNLSEHTTDKTDYETKIINMNTKIDGLGEHHNSREDIHCIKQDKLNSNTSQSTDILNETNKNVDSVQSEIHCEPLKRSLLNKTEMHKLRNETSEIDTGSDNETALIKEEIVDEESAIKVKVELVTTWTDSDNFQPFRRDANAMERDGVRADAVIVEGDSNIAEVIEAAKNGPSQNTFYECSHCNLLFKHPKRFIIHSKWHTFGLTNDKRQELAKEKETRRTLKREARIIERLNSDEVKNKEGEETVHACKDCDKVFKMKNSLKNHRQRYHPRRVRECKICRATVVGWMALREHLRSHTGGGGFQCAECPKRFKYAHSLAKHRDTHLEKTHGCEQCEKKFGSQALLKMHMKCHERTARGAIYRCTYCGKGFFESYNLQVHERTHRNERPFLCDICHSSFGTNSSLKRHLKVSHSSSKPFSCPTCRRCFATANTRDRHTARVHGDQSVFGHACTLCTRRYRAFKDLQKHVYKAHSKATDDEQV